MSPDMASLHGLLRLKWPDICPSEGSIRSSAMAESEAWRVANHLPILSVRS